MMTANASFRPGFPRGTPFFAILFSPLGPAKFSLPHHNRFRRVSQPGMKGVFPPGRLMKIHSRRTPCANVLQIFCLLLLPCLTLMGILGRGSPAALSTSSNAAIPPPPITGDCLPCGARKHPIGNATADFLTQYDAWYVGDTSQKVIYLTLTAATKNGNHRGHFGCAGKSIVLRRLLRGGPHDRIRPGHRPADGARRDTS